ncbi:MAG: fructose-bisphosphatase class II family protein [Chloroflexota bacterium]|nr:fructose-bisphosphatase class II family protein [Chloroflexota bacterium]
MAGRWMGLGSRDEPDRVATEAMHQALNLVDVDGRIVVGEEGKLGWESPLKSGKEVCSGDGPAMDVVVDAIDGRGLLASGRAGAIAVAAVAPRGAMWCPRPAVYMEKVVVNREAAESLVPEVMDAPAAWTLALVARVKKKEVRDLVVFVLDRPRHRDLINEIRAAGARVMLRSDGDIAGALMAASPNGRVDILMGVGGVPEGLVAACAVKALGGAMLGRLAPQNEREHEALEGAELDMERIVTDDELVSSDAIYFAATGITDGPLLDGVTYHGRRAETHSLILRGETHSRRFIRAEHLLED